MIPRIRQCDINWQHQGVQGSTQRGVASAELRTVRDVSNRETLKDAKHQFDRCVTDADFAAWGRRWGEALVMDALNRKHRQ